VPAGAGREEGRGVVLLIAAFKLAKAIVLITVGCGALSLLHRDVATTVAGWVRMLRVDPDDRVLRGVIARLWTVDDRELERIGVGTFFYAALMGTEGVVLLRGKPWGEWFTVIATGSLIPLEVWETLGRASPTKLVVIALNVAVVAYLVRRVRRRTG